MTSHLTTIDTRDVVAKYSTGFVWRCTEYGWRCSCGAAAKDWRKTIRAARNGGTRHVAAMERR